MESFNNQVAKKGKNLHEGHRKRIKEKFLENGFTASTPPHEVLELLLCYCVPRKDTNELAHRLLDRFGSIAGVMDASREELTEFPGLTDNAYCLFRLIMPVAKMYLDGEFDMGSYMDYVERVITFLEYLSPDTVIQRVIGRAKEEHTIFANYGSSWWKIKDTIDYEMEKRNTSQGIRCNYLGGSALNKFKNS